MNEGASSLVSAMMAQAVGDLFLVSCRLWCLYLLTLRNV